MGARRVTQMLTVTRGLVGVAVLVAACSGEFEDGVEPVDDARGQSCG